MLKKAILPAPREPGPLEGGHAQSRCSWVTASVSVGTRDWAAKEVGTVGS